MDPLKEGHKLLSVLLEVKDVCDKKRNNVEVMRELSLFIQNLNQAIDVLQRRILDRLRPRTRDSSDSDTSWSEDLAEDLQCAAESLGQCLKVPRNAWNLITLLQRLRTVREIVINRLQIKLEISSFNVSTDEGLKQQQEEFKTSLQGHRGSRAFPNSVRQNFSSIREEVQCPPASEQYPVPDELRSLPRPGVEILPAHRRTDSGDSVSDSIGERMTAWRNMLQVAEIAQTRVASRAIGTTETESFFADVLANLEEMREQVNAEAESRSRHNEEEIAEWFEDPITGEIMCDPIKCTDGRTYDRWTIIDNNLVKCPYDASMSDFRIAFDDIDVRARLFRAFPEKEENFRTRRQLHRQKALEHVRRGEYTDALVKLNQVLQWNCVDEECKSKRDSMQRLLQHDTPPPPALTPIAPVSSSARSLRERIRRCSITSWLWRTRSR